MTKLPMENEETAALMGALTAPATHDLMNVLAIIAERIGLLSDLQQLNEPQGLTPEKLQSGIRAIEAQVARGRETLIHLNRLSHAAQSEAEQINADDAVTEVVHLTQRRFNARISGNVPAHTLCCNALAFRRLIFGLLDAACPAPGPDSVAVSMEKEERSLSITITGKQPIDSQRVPTQLAESLGAHLKVTRTTLTLILPSR